MSGLDPARARTLYNVADAFEDVGSADVASDLDERLAARSPAERRRLLRALRWLEWEPRLRLRSHRGFSWLDRGDRRRTLERWERSRWPFRRRSFELLREVVREGLGQSPTPA